jgi:hypothetical protein
MLLLLHYPQHQDQQQNVREEVGGKEEGEV